MLMTRADTPLASVDPSNVATLCSLPLMACHLGLSEGAANATVVSAHEGST